jgi:hypothetical protein
MITPDNEVGTAQDVHTISNKRHRFPESIHALHKLAVLQHTLAVERGAGPLVWRYKPPAAPRNSLVDTSAVEGAPSPASRNNPLRVRSQGIADRS